jgi:hypothetical protein
MTALPLPGSVHKKHHTTSDVQTPEKVLMISTQDHQVRQIFLNRQHSENVKPSWFGESVSHYDAGTLVVDPHG